MIDLPGSRSTKRHRRRGGALLVALAVVASVLAPSGVASAHDYEAPGIDDAQLYLTPDGYDGNGGVNTFLGVVPANVKGKLFEPNSVAHVYLCRAGEIDFPAGCQEFGAAPTMPDGTFSGSFPGWNPAITRSDGSQINCVGAAGEGRVQCAVVAATFAGVGFDQPTAKAEHYVCFYRPEDVNGCVPGPEGPTVVPPNSLRGERLVVSKDRELSVYAEPILVSGSGFVGGATAEIFKCAALADNLRAECQRIGAAATDSNGSFGPVPAAFDNLTPNQCAGNAPQQCSVVAATFDGPTATESTSRAEYYVCVTGSFYPCTPGDPTIPVPPPTLPPEWQPGAPMSTGRQRFATAAASGGRIYAMGGHRADGSALATTEVLDSCGARRWKPLPSMSTPRTDFAAAAGPDGRIYAIGGTDVLWGTPLATVEAYDPAMNRWSAVANLAVPRSRLAATTGPDGRIYAIGGGVGQGGGQPVATVEAYDPETNAWTLVTPLTVGRAEAAALTVPDGRIFVLGGDSTSITDPPIEYYSPGPEGAPGLWQVRSLKRQVPDDAAVTVGPDGLVYIVGGMGFSLQILRGVVVYDPIYDSWKDLTEPMTAHRTTASAAAGTDGRLYAIGGTDDPSAVDGPPPLASTETLQVGPNTCPRLTQPADFDGDFDTDVSVFRPESGTWFAKDGATVAYGAEGDIPVPADYDGDQVTEVAIFRPSVGLWAIHRSSDDTDVFLTYGIGTDIPVPADYDGDDKADIAIYRPQSATWWVRHSSTGLDVPTTFGIPTDTPVPADYDGDTKADIAVFRKGTWFSLPSGGGSAVTSTYGALGDIPVPADYDNDRVMDRAVFRPTDGTWSLHRSSDNTDETFAFGIAGDVPQPGDYNGDRISDPAVFRPSTGEWLIETGEEHAWGAPTDIPLPVPPSVRLAFFGGG